MKKIQSLKNLLNNKTGRYFSSQKLPFYKKSDFCSVKMSPFYLKFNFITHWVNLTILLAQLLLFSLTHSVPQRLFPPCFLQSSFLLSTGTMPKCVQVCKSEDFRLKILDASVCGLKISFIQIHLLLKCVVSFCRTLH